VNRARARGAACWLALCAMLAAPVGSAAAEPAPQAGEVIPVALVLNGEPRGDIFVRRVADGSIQARADSIAGAGARILGGERHIIDGAEWVAVGTIPGARHEFDEASLSLSLNLPPESFDAQRRAVTGPPRAAPADRPDAVSAFLNYRVGTGRVADAQLNTFASEVGGRRGEWLLRSESLLETGDTGSRFTRFQTQAIRDERARARRWVVGDTFANSGLLGSALSLGGAGLSTAYQMTPYFVRYPSATFAGAAALPSDVEVYVGDTRVFHDRFAPGPFEVRDFNYYGGRQDVRIVTRDALGQEQVHAYPFYFTDQALAAGLHEFSYNAGALREDYGSESDGYGPPAASAMHRYGLNDELTVGGRGEYGDGRWNLGPLATLRSNRFGTLALGAALGAGGEAGGGTGAAYAAAYEYRYGMFNARTSTRRLAEGYGLADPFANDAAIESENIVGVGYGLPRLGTLDVQAIDSQARGAPGIRSVAFSYSRSLLGRGSLFANVRRDDDGSAASTTAFVGCSFTFGSRASVGAFHSSTETSQADSLQVSSTLGPREGVGYRFAAEQVRYEQYELNRVTPYLEYNARPASLIVQGRSEESSTGEKVTTWETAAQGSVYYVPGTWGLARRVDDSFAIARISPPVEGVRVYRNGEEVGRTDAEGLAFVPGVSAFLDNQVKIEQKDVPMAYALRSVTETIAPPFRSGTLVDFDARRSLGVVGNLRRAGRPLEYRTGTLQVGEASQPFLTGSDGEFYLEDLAPGSYAGLVATDAGACSFEVVVPASDGPLLELAEAVTCAP
jgi:outer membrane usher protein